MHVIERTSETTCNFVISNTGQVRGNAHGIPPLRNCFTALCTQGVDNHPSLMKYPKERFRTSIVLRDISLQRLADPGVLYMLAQLRTNGKDLNGPTQVYDVLVPHLTGKTLEECVRRTEAQYGSWAAGSFLPESTIPASTGVGEGGVHAPAPALPTQGPALGHAPWTSLQRSGTCYYRAVLAAFKYLLHRWGVSVSRQKEITLAVRAGYLKVALVQLRSQAGLEDTADEETAAPLSAPASVGLVRASSSAIELGVSRDRKVLELGHWETKMLALGCDLTAHAMGKNLKAGHSSAAMVPALYELIEAVRAFIGGDEGQFIAPPDGTTLLSPQRAAEIGADPQVYELAHKGLLVPALGARVRVKMGMTALDDIGRVAPDAANSEQSVHEDQAPLVTVYVSGTSLSLPSLVRLNASQEELELGAADAQPSANAPTTLTASKNAVLDKLEPLPGFDLLQDSRDTAVFMGGEAEGTPDAFVNLVFPLPGLEQLENRSRAIAQAVAAAEEAPALDEEDDAADTLQHASAFFLAPVPASNACSWSETLQVLKSTAEACDSVRQQAGSGDSAAGAALHTVMSLVETAMLQALPVPLPWTAERAAAGVPDAWTPDSLTAAEQRDALMWIHSVLCHYTSAYRSLPYDRNTVGTYLVTAATICAAFDSTIRLVASDAPSPVSLLLQGVNECWADSKNVQLVPFIEAAGIEIDTAAAAAERKRKDSKDAPDNRPVQEILAARTAHKYATQFAKSKTCALPAFAPAFTMLFHLWEAPDAGVQRLTDYALGSSAPLTCAARPAVCAYWDGQKSAANAKGEDMTPPPQPGQAATPPPTDLAAQLQLPSAAGRFGRALKFTSKDAWVAFTQYLLVDMKQATKMPPSAPPLPFTDTQVAASAAASGQGAFLYTAYWLSEDWDAFPEYNLLRSFLVLLTSVPAVFQYPEACFVPLRTHFPDDAHSQWRIQRNYAAEAQQQGGQQDAADLEVKHFGKVWQNSPRLQAVPEYDKLSSPLSLVGLKAAPRPQGASGGSAGASGVMGRIMEAMSRGDMQGMNDILMEAADEHDIPIPDDPNDPAQGMQFMSQVMAKIGGGGGAGGGMGMMPFLPPGGMGGGGMGGGGAPGCPMQTALPPADERSDAAAVNSTLLAPQLRFLMQQSDERDAAIAACLAMLRSAIPGQKPTPWQQVPLGAPGAQEISGTDDEERILRVQALPTFDSSLSPQDSEALMGLLTVPYLRIPLLLRFFSENRLGALFHPKLQLLLERVLLEPGPITAPGAKVRPTQLAVVPADASAESELFATPAGLLVNELWHSPEGVVDPLLQIAHSITGLCGGHYSSTFTKLLFFVLKLVHRVEASLYFVADAHAAAGSLDTLQGRAAARTLGQLRRFTLGTARACIVRYLDQTEEDFERLGKAAASAAAAADVGNSNTSEAVAADRDEVTRIQVNLHAHHALLFAFLAAPSSSSASADDDTNLTDMTPSHAQALLSSAAFVSAWSSPSVEQPLGSDVPAIVSADGNTQIVPTSDVFKALARQRRAILSIVDSLPSQQRDAVLDAVLSTSLRRPEARPGWEAASKPAFKCLEHLQSSHPYLPAVDQYTTLSFPGAESMTLTFDSKSSTNSEHDYVIIYTSSACASYWGAGKHSLGDGWPGAGGRPPLIIPADTAVLHFHSSGESKGDWGWAVQVEATINATAASELSAEQLPATAKHALSSAFPGEQIPPTPPVAWAQAAMARSLNDTAAARAYLHTNAATLAGELGMDGGKRPAADGVAETEDTQSGLFRDATGSVQIDVQTGEIFIKNRSRAPVPSSLASHSNFTAVFGNERPLASLLKSKLHAKTYELDHGLFTYRLVSWSPVGAPPVEREAAALQGQAAPPAPDGSGDMPPPAPPLLRKSSSAVAADDDEFALTEQATHWGMPRRVKGAVHWRGSVYSSRFSAQNFAHDLEEALVAALTAAELPAGVQRDWYVLPEGQRSKRHGRNRVSEAEDVFSTSRLTARVLREFEWLVPSITATLALVENHVVQAKDVSAQGGDVDNSGGKGLSRMWTPNGCMHSVAAMVLAALGLRQQASRQQEAAVSAMAVDADDGDAAAPIDAHVPLRALWFMPPGGDFLQRLGKPGTWYSVELLAQRRVVNIYQLLETGRHTQRTLVASSDSRYALRSIDVVPSTMAPDQLLHARYAVACPYTLDDPAALITERNKAVAVAAAQRTRRRRRGRDAAVTSGSHLGSIVISRKFAAAGDSGLFSRTWESHVPHYQLYGSIPHALIEAYEFWKGMRPTMPSAPGLAQDSAPQKAYTTVIRGYPSGNVPSAAGTVLEIELQEGGHGTVRRFTDAAFKAFTSAMQAVASTRQRADQSTGTGAALVPDTERTVWPVFIDSMAQLDPKAISVLIDVTYARRAAPARRIADALCRIESLSHILVWSHTLAPVGAQVPVSRIELPRLGTSFTPKTDARGQLRVYCDEFAGHFLSDDRDASILKHMSGIPHSVLLANSAGEHSILVPNLPLHRPQAKSEPFTTDIIAGHGEGWEDAVSSRLYRYPIHASGAFLTVPSVASAWYLVLLRLLHRDYEGASELLPACATDVTFSAEEAWVANMVNRTAGEEQADGAQQAPELPGSSEIKIDAPDMHPNIHALRLRLALIQQESGQSGPLKADILKKDFGKYVSKLPHVAAFARLTPSEELDVANAITGWLGAGSAGDFDKRRREHASLVMSVLERNASAASKVHAARAALQARLKDLDEPTQDGSMLSLPTASPPLSPGLSRQVSTHRGATIVRAATVQSPHPFAGALLTESAMAGAAAGAATADSQRGKVLWQLKRFAGATDVSVEFDAQSSLVSAGTLRLFLVPAVLHIGDSAEGAPESAIQSESGVFGSEADIPEDWELVDSYTSSADDAASPWAGCQGKPAAIVAGSAVAIVFVPSATGGAALAPPTGRQLLGRKKHTMPWGWKAAFNASVPASSFGADDSDAVTHAVQLIRRPSSGMAGHTPDERAEMLQALEQLVEPSVSERWTLSGPSWGKGSRIVLNTLQQVAGMFTGTGVLREGGEPPAPAHSVDSILSSWSAAPGSIFEYSGTILDKASETNGTKVANPPRTVQGSRYVRPKAEPDAGGQVAWWELLEKCWNDDSPDLLDRVERPGFMFMYEVLSSAVPVDICTVLPKADPTLQTEEEKPDTGGAAAGGMAAADEKLREWMDQERDTALSASNSPPGVTSAATATYMRLILLGMLAHHSQGQGASRIDKEAYLTLIAATYAARAAAEGDMAMDVQARAQMSGGAVSEVATRMGPDAVPGDVFSNKTFPMLPLHDLSQAILSQERSVVSIEYFITVQYSEFTEALGNNADLAQAFQVVLGQQPQYGPGTVARLLWYRVQQCLVRAMNSGAPLEEQRQINQALSAGASSGVFAVVAESEAAGYIEAHESWQAQTVIIDASSAGPRRPVITDCTCACRVIQLPDDDSAAEYEQDLLDFAHTPLQQIADSHVVEVPGEGHSQHNAGRLTSSLPFDLSISKRGAAAAGSAVGSGMVERMAGDLSESSLQASARMQHQLASINSSTLHQLRSSLTASTDLVSQLEDASDMPTLQQASGFTPETAEQVKAAIADLRALRAALQELAAVDQALTASSLRELVVRANSVLHESQGPLEQRLAFALCRSHGDSARITFSFLAAAVMSPSPEAAVLELNPHLPQKEVLQLIHETQLLLLRSNRVSQIERCISDSNSVEARMRQLVNTRLTAACKLLVLPGTCVPDKDIVEQAVVQSQCDPLAAAELLHHHMAASATVSESLLTSLGEVRDLPSTEAARLRMQAPVLAALLLSLHYAKQGSFTAAPISSDALLTELAGGEHEATASHGNLRGYGAKTGSSPADAIKAAAHVLEFHAMSRAAFRGQLLSPPARPAQAIPVQQQVTRFAQDVKSSSALLHVLRHSAQRLAGQITAKRQFMFSGPQAASFQYDPRFLVFEFVSTFILRRRQIELVNDFLRAAYAGDSSVCQMIMGQGKTTVVGPLLALILADGSTLVTQVCPSPLLEQTKAVLRGVFCSVIAKRVLTLKFDRSNAAFFPDEAGGGLAAGLPKLQALVSKLERARADRAIVATTPETLKSIMLKYVDLLATAAEAPVETRMPTQDIPAQVVAAAAKRQAQNVVAAEAAADHLRNLMSLWGGTAVWDGVLADAASDSKSAPVSDGISRFPGLDKAVPSSGVMLLDEVDLLLHSLKSELNFPVGVKHRLHMWPRRWELPIHLLDLLFASCDSTSAVAQLMSEGTAPAAAQHSDAGAAAGDGQHDATAASGSGEVLGLAPGSVVSGMGRVAVPGFRPTRESDGILEDMRQALAFGVQSFAVQPLPHPTLLSPSFYDGYLKRVIARWAVLWLRTQAAVQRAFGTLPLATAVPGVTALAGLITVEPAEVITARAAAFRAPDTRSMAGEFLMGNAPSLGAEAEDFIVQYISGAKVPESEAAGFVAAAVGSLTEDVAAVTASIALDPSAMAQADEEVDGEAKPLAPEAAIAALHELPGHAMQCVNLARDWVTTFMPHCMSKINRVSYGLLTPRDVARYTPEALARMPRSRKLLAVPFVGKDVPSDASEFAHPEVLIGLSICAMRYEGVREGDLKVVMKSLKSDLQHEPGRMEHRPTRVLFSDWLSRADNDYIRVLDSLKLSADARRSLLNASPSQAVLPLELAQPREETQFNAMFSALRRSPEVISHYLRHHVFMEVMRHQDIKLTATGVDLGSDMLFGVRLGFSGTPSDLLPLSLRPCHYEPGSEADIVRTLTSDELVDAITLAEWSVTSLLKFVATSAPPFHALIDTGALVTGMNNEQVARFLLAVGLPNMRGCVFLNDSDRKCIVLREGGTVMRLEECGIPPSQRFTFYDQTHCTGMHIDQALDARAAITLGKDMTLRDYAQGAWRMRGLGKGQTLTAIVVPEVRELIEGVVKKDKRSKHGTAAKVSLLSVEQVVSGAPPLPDSPDSVASSIDSTPPPPPPLVLQNSLSASVPLAVRISTQASGLHLNLPSAVVAWLTFNSIKSEQLQYLALCQQNISYAWRRTAFTDLMTSTQPPQQSIDMHGIATRFHAPVSDAEKCSFLQSVPSLAAQMQEAHPAAEANPLEMTEGQRRNNRLADLIARDPAALTDDEQMELVMLMSSLDAEAAEADSTASTAQEAAADSEGAQEDGQAGEAAQPAAAAPVEVIRGSTQWLQMCVSAFREPLDMAVVDELPLPQRFEDKLDDAVRQWRQLIDAEGDRPVRGAGPDGALSTRQYVAAILEEARLAASASDQDGDEDKALAHDKEMVQEQEKEQEQEAQVEIQQEVETQFADGSDAVMPWPLTALRVPDAEEHASGDAASSPSAEFAAMLAANGPSVQSLVSQGLFYPLSDLELLRGKGALKFPAGLLVSQNHTPQLASPSLPRRLRNVSLVLQLPFDTAAPQSVVLSLIEAQTVRRAIHLRHPALRKGLKTPAAGIILRMANGVALDGTVARLGDEAAAIKVPTSQLTQQRLAAKFFNNNAWFSEAEVLGLVTALKAASPAEREAFYAESIIGRRRDKQAWGETGLRSVFRLADESSLLQIRKWVDAARECFVSRHGSLTSAYTSMAGSVAVPISTAAFSQCVANLQISGLDDAAAEALAVSVDGDHDGQLTFADFFEAFRPLLSADSRARTENNNASVEGLERVQAKQHAMRAAYVAHAAEQQKQQAASGATALDDEPSLGGAAVGGGDAGDDGSVFVAKQVAQATGTIADHLNASEVLSVGELLLTSGGSVSIDSDAVVCADDDGVASVSPRRVLLKRKQYFYECNVNTLGSNSARTGQVHRIAAVGFGDARFSGDSHADIGVGDAANSWSLAILALPARDVVLPAGADVPSGDDDEDHIVHVAVLRLAAQPYAACSLEAGGGNSFLDMLAPHATPDMRNVTVTAASVAAEQPLAAIRVFPGDAIGATVDADTCTVRFSLNNKPVVSAAGADKHAALQVRGGFVASASVTRHAALSVNVGSLPFRHMPPDGAYSIRRAGRRTQEVKVVREAGDAAGKFVPTAEVEGIQVKNNVVKNIGYFPTAVMAGVLLTSGKWYYECTALVKGHGSQIGWGDIEFCGLGGGRGAGDDEHSYAFDGERVCLWHRQSSPPFGRAWHNGDTIGFAVDLDARTMSFGINGQWTSPLGKAFSDIKFSCGLTPAVTPQGSATFAFNMGEGPMRYPPPNEEYNTVWQWLVGRKPDLAKRTKGGALPGEPVTIVNNPDNTIYGLQVRQGTHVSADEDLVGSPPPAAPLARGVSTINTVRMLADQASIPLRVTSGFRLVSRRGNRYELKVQGNLPPSIVADQVSVRSGKWYYEVRLNTAAGNSQVVVGWADLTFAGRWAARRTVGDDSASWGWNASLGEYRHAKQSFQLAPQKLMAGGTPAQRIQLSAGDVIGVALDADVGTMSFTVNGAWDTRASSAEMAAAAHAAREPTVAERRDAAMARAAAAQADEDWDAIAKLTMEIEELEAEQLRQDIAATEGAAGAAAEEDIYAGAASQQAQAAVEELGAAGLIAGALDGGFVGGLVPAVSASYDTVIAVNFGGPEGQGLKYGPPPGYSALHERLGELQAAEISR